jgi:hypothetical protein
MAGTSEQRGVAAKGYKEWASSALVTLGRLVLALSVCVVLASLYLPLISVFISRYPPRMLTAFNADVAYQKPLLSLETTLAYRVLSPEVRQILRSFEYEPAG